LLRVLLSSREELKALKDIIVGPTMMAYTNKEQKKSKKMEACFIINENKLLLICGVLNYHLTPEGVLKVVSTLPSSNPLREQLLEHCSQWPGK